MNKKSEYERFPSVEVVRALPLGDIAETSAILEPYWRRFVFQAAAPDAGHTMDLEALRWMALGNKLMIREGFADELRAVDVSVIAMDADRYPTFEKLVNELTAFWDKVIAGADLIDRRRLWAFAYAQALDEMEVGTNSLHYGVKPKDLEVIQQRLNDLREVILGSTELSESKRRQLLRRVEKVQAALNERMDTLDRLAGALVDLQVIARSAGDAGIAVATELRRVVPYVLGAIAVFEGPELIGSLLEARIALPGGIVAEIALELPDSPPDEEDAKEAADDEIVTKKTLLSQ